MKKTIDISLTFEQVYDIVCSIDDCIQKKVNECQAVQLDNDYIEQQTARLRDLRNYIRDCASLCR